MFPVSIGRFSGSWRAYNYLSERHDHCRWVHVVVTVDGGESWTNVSGGYRAVKLFASPCFGQPTRYPLTSPTNSSPSFSLFPPTPHLKYDNEAQRSTSDSYVRMVAISFRPAAGNGHSCRCLGCILFKRQPA